MNPLKACSFLALALLTPVFGADAKPTTKLDALSDKQLKETLDATRSQLAANARKHEASHTDWVKAKKDAQAIEDEIAKLKQALAELDRKAGAAAKDIKKLEDVHAATEQAEKALRSTLAAQEKELAKRSEIRKLEEQAAKLKAQAKALEKRAAELK
jgi:chromosome segregation ATPase